MATIYISGMHSGPNPSPGLGVIRSLRGNVAHRLIGVDYSPNSSGLHSHLLDEVFLFPSWSEIDSEVWVDQIRGLLGPDDLYLSTLDLETRLLAKLRFRRGILSPTANALVQVVKPPVEAARQLGFTFAPSMDALSDPRDVASFLRHAPSGAWVKGEHYEAIRVHTVDQFRRATRYVELVWGGQVHLEQHIEGQEVGIAFVAREGQLIDSVSMEKSVLTPTGKTWSGRVSEPSRNLVDRLSTWVAARHWHGAGELELIRTWGSEFFLMEINPRFPAWIHGASVTGRNLPLGLLRGKRERSTSLSLGFTRVVEEIALNDALGIPSFPWPGHALIDSASKHPSGMPVVAQLFVDKQPGAIKPVSPDDLAASSWTSDIGQDTPAWSFDDGHLRENINALQSQVSSVPTELAYSVKTNPDARLIAVALQAGMAMEVISQDEYRHVLDCGADPSRVILNGPAKWWRTGTSLHVDGLFLDSVAEAGLLKAYLDAGNSLTANFLGVRLSLQHFDSRFGINVDDLSEFEQIGPMLKYWCDRLEVDWGVHFHFAESVIGPSKWTEACITILAAAQVLGNQIGIAPSIVDFGGGWHTGDLRRLPSSLETIRKTWSQDTSAPRWMLELGKSLVESCAALRTTVIAGPRPNGDVVVDAGIPELPDAMYRDHQVQHLNGMGSALLAPGTARVLGRTCMENDVLARNVDTSKLRPGDQLLFVDAGGYDYSMSYVFGRGEQTR